MPTLLYTEGALEDLRRVADFLWEKDVAAAQDTAALLMQALEVLAAHPLIGRPVGGGLHELIISRGRTGYVAVYDDQAVRDRVLVLAIRHQREAGFEAGA